MDEYDTDFDIREGKTTDSRGHALRWAENDPGRFEGDTTVLTPRDILIFQAIQRHDLLTATQIHGFVGGEYTTLQKRLQKLRRCKKTEFDGVYLHCPQEQFSCYKAHLQPLVYELTDYAREALADDEKQFQFQLPDTSHFVHRAFNACVSASIELAARKAGFTYRCAEEIFTHPKCPELSVPPMTIQVDEDGLIHDRLFAIDYPGEGSVFYVVEVDRSTEMVGKRKVTRTNKRDNSYSHKITLTEKALARKLYRKAWGIPDPVVLTVTTLDGRMDTLIEHVREHTKDPRHYMLRTRKTFGKRWRIPKEVQYDLFEKPWYTTAEPFFINRA